MTTPYAPMEWTAGPITLGGLQQLASNDQWLFENMPFMYYQGPQINRYNGLKVAAGRTLYPSTPGYDYANVSVYFGNFFTAGCNPVVVSTVHSWGGLRQLSTVRGLNSEQNIDSRGFIAHISSQENYPGGKNRIYGGVLNWVAVGY